MVSFTGVMERIRECWRCSPKEMALEMRGQDNINQASNKKDKRPTEEDR